MKQELHIRSIDESNRATLPLDDWSLEAIFVLDDTLTCVDVNKAASKLFQYSREELIGYSGRRVLSDEGFQITLQKTQSQSTHPYKLPMTRRDGTTFLALVQGRNIVIDGKPMRISSVRDISELRDIEGDFSDKNHQLAASTNSTMCRLCIENSDSPIDRANDAAAQITSLDDAGEFSGNENDYDVASADNSASIKSKFTVPLKSRLRRWLGVFGGRNDTAQRPTPARLDDQISTIDQAEARKNEALHELEIIFNNALVGIVVIGADRKIIKANDRFAAISGYSNGSDLCGLSLREMHLSDESYRAFGDKCYSALSTQKIEEFEYQVKRKDGQTIWVAVAGRVLDADSPVNLDNGVVWVVRDITEEKTVEQQLLQLTRVDPLTDVSNRRFFVEQANREIDIMQRYKKKLSLLMLDVDRFKQINDTYGHCVGDKALSFVAKICRESVRENDIVGRLGGEEFAVLLLEADLHKAGEVGTRIIHDLNQYSAQVTGQYRDIPSLTASIGAVELKQDDTLETALKQADELLYKAKGNGRNRLES